MPDLDRECILRLSFYRNFGFGEVLGGSIFDRSGTNRCKKSEWLKTGQRVAASEFRNGGVGPLKQYKQARHLTATERIKHALRA